MPEVPKSVAAVTRGTTIVAGVSMVVGVVAVYAMALRDGRWPSGHPWSGLTFVAMAAMFLLQSAQTSGRPTSVRVLNGLALIAAVLWFISAWTAS